MSEALTTTSRPLKRRKINHLSVATRCCSCQEENVPYLLLVGCSNRHVMCHLCTRMFISSKIVMNRFPRYFPGKISTREDLECPLCRETINGLTNMFVFTEDQKADQTFECPYKELLTKETIRSIGCSKKMSLSELHKHLIQLHNQTVRCPNCSTWLCDGEKNMEDLLQFHVMKHCQDVKCYGCDRTSNMLNMYMHSLIGRDRVCDTAKQLFHSFGKHLSECFYLFEDHENMTQLSTMMLRWVAQYLYQRQNGPELGLDVFGKHFHRIFYAFVLQVFCRIHSPLVDTEFATLLNKVLELASKSDRNEYEENILLYTSAFAHQYGRRLDHVSQLPFFYRLIVMSLSDFQHAQKLIKRYPKNITPTEQADISKLVDVYQQIIPEETMSTITLQFPQFSMVAPGQSDAAT